MFPFTQDKKNIEMALNNTAVHTYAVLKWHNTYFMLSSEIWSQIWHGVYGQ